MHYHMEVIIPPTDDPKSDVEQLLAPFDENYVDEYGSSNNPHAFWDWWVIGGRWSRDHILSQITDDRMRAFEADVPEYWVGSVQSAGGGFYERPSGSKNPANILEILVVIWEKHFPEFADRCPFWGMTDQYKKGGLAEDVVAVETLGESQACNRLLIGWNPSGTVKDLRMWQKDFYNGVDWQDAKWDGVVLASINRHNDKVRETKGRAEDDWWEEFGSKQIVRPNWLAVTVDYHC